MFSQYEKLAAEKGYYVDNDGKAYSPQGRQVGTCGSSGYLYFGIRIDKKTIIKVLIHRMQAYQKFGEQIYEKGLEIRHLDGCCTNNSYENIEIGTHSQNMCDIPRDIRIKNAYYASSQVKKLRKYTDEEVLEMRRLYKLGASYNDIMKMYGINSKGTINYLIKKRLSRGRAVGSLSL